MSRTKYAKFMMNLKNDSKEINSVEPCGLDYNEKETAELKTCGINTEIDDDTLNLYKGINRLKDDESNIKEATKSVNNDKNDEFKKDDEPNQNNFSDNNKINSDNISNKDTTKNFKNDTLYNMLGNDKGVTLDELQAILGWEQKSIRGNMTNIQKKRQFSMITVNISTPDFNTGDFKKTTYFFRRNVEFDIENDFLKKLTND